MGLCVWPLSLPRKFGRCPNHRLIVQAIEIILQLSYLYPACSDRLELSPFAILIFDFKAQPIYVRLPST